MLLHRLIATGLLALCLLGAGVRAELLLQGKVTPLSFSHQGPFVRTADDAIWGMDAAGALVSANEGQTWAARPVYDAGRFQSRPERALLRTREGVILYAFLNQKERVFLWDDQKGGPQEGCRLPVYLSRSADDGKTWAAPVLLQDGWCGAVRQMIQLRSGRIILVSQQAAANPGRHVTIIHYSDDLGLSWRTAPSIDLGEAGNYRDPVTGLSATTHGGGIEGTILERRDGSLLLLLRVPHGCFYQLTSRDGVTWSRSMPSTIEASDSPGMLLRLASGRVALVWNRFRDPVKRTGRREALSIAFSENDGVTWSLPQVIALNPVPAGKREGEFWISYPYLFEVAPGRLWVSTMQGKLSAALNEADFLAPVSEPIDEAGVRIVTLGDSITRGSRYEVKPTETFAALLQARLRASGTPVTVHNVGIGSERTDQALLRLDRDVLSQRSHIVTVMYGTNDSWVDPGKSVSRLTEDQYESNLREIVRRLQAARIRVVLMTAPKFGESNPRNGLGEDPNIRLARYVERCRKVAHDTGVPLVDHFGGWAAEQEQGRRLQAWTTDGCHPNQAGHADLVARLLPVMTSLTATLSPAP